MQLWIDKIKTHSLLALFDTHNSNYVKDEPHISLCVASIAIVQSNLETLILRNLKVVYNHIT